MNTPRRVAVGCIVGTHGLRGSLKVRYFGNGPDHLLDATEVTLGADVEDSDAVAMEVLSTAPGRANEVRMTLAGIEDHDAASQLRGRLLMLDPDEFSPLEDGEYYEYELVGCRVEGDDGIALGTVREVWPTGASDVLVVASEEGKQHLIPTAGGFVREVDIDERRIVVAVIPGLLDPGRGER